jgi:predicted enzyme related to lactoylglutathione lyase
MKANPVGWFEIYVSDLTRARAFYEGLLNVTMTAIETPDSTVAGLWAFPMDAKAAGAAGALASMKGEQQPRGTGTIVYFSCDDCAVEAQRAPLHGGTIKKDKWSIGPHGFMALVVDPEGNIVGLHSMK